MDRTGTDQVIVGDRFGGHGMNPPTRHTVRIIRRRGPSRVALVSLISAFAAAAVLFAAWRIWRTKEVTVPYERMLADVILDYRCEAEHAFNALGQPEAMSCPTCGRPAYPLTRYECRMHGTFEVAVRFGLDEIGRTFVSKLRLAGERWVDEKDGLTCPRCTRSLAAKLAEDLSDLGMDPERQERRLPFQRRRVPEP